MREAAAAVLRPESWTARSATREPAYAFSSYAYQHRVDRFIASARLAFTLCALLAITVAPSEPAASARHVLLIVTAYTLYAMTTVAWVWSSAASLGHRVRFGTQIIDVVVAIVLVTLSGGPHSLFLVFMIFPLLSASLQWKQGALWTGGSSLAAFGAVALYAILSSGSGALELHSFIIGVAYLIVVTLVFAHLAAHDDRTRRVMGAVATWTTSRAGGAEAGLREILSHVASIVEAPRVLLVWQAADQPHPIAALWTHEQFHCRAEPRAAFELMVVEPLRDCDFVCNDAAQSGARVVCVTERRSSRWRGRPLGDALLTAFAIRAVMAVRLPAASLRGRLLLLDKPAATSDDLVLASVVARQVASVLEHDNVARQIQEAALAHERARVARDVHDGALQSLAGAAIRLETIRRQLEDHPAAARDALHELQTVIMLQQRELRSFVHELQTGGAAKDSAFADLLTALALRIQQEWQLAVKLDVTLPPGRFDALISPELAREIHQIIREALVNAARHTLASFVRVGIGLDGDWVRITVADNGQGFPFRGRFEDAELAERNLGPVMLRQRIAALGGRLVIETSDQGAQLEISVPRCGTVHTRSKRNSGLSAVDSDEVLAADPSVADRSERKRSVTAPP
jgi:signal transduction histidine kinase